METALIGLGLGMILFLVSAGVTIVFGVLGVINFAHAAYFTLGAFVAFETTYKLNSFWLALPSVIVLCVLLGAAQEILTFRPIYRFPHAFQLIASLGYSLLVLAAIQYCWGLDYRNVPRPPQLSSVMELGGVVIPTYRVAITVVSAMICLALFWLMQRSRVGTLIRAASSNSVMLECLGINVLALRTGVVGASAALAGLAGVMVAPLAAVQLDMGNKILLDSFLVAALGGLGSVLGALLVSLLVGVSQAYGQSLLPDWSEFLIYAISLTFLIVRPIGLFGHKTRRA
jgi:branched-chain amino acid transport system permease protein